MARLKFGDKWVRFWHFGSDQRIECYTILSTLIDVMPLTRALEVIYDTQTDDRKKPNASYAPIIAAWQKSLRGSGNSQAGRDGNIATPFATAVRPWVPSGDYRLILAGERSSNLRPALRRIIDTTQKMKELTSRSLVTGRGMALNISMLLGLATGFSTIFTPILANLAPRRSWVGPGAVLGAASDLFSDYLSLVMGTLGTLIVLILVAMPFLTGGLRQRLDRWPPFNWYAMWQAGMFMLEFSAMTLSGIPDTDALTQITSQGNRWLRWNLRRIARELRAGAANFGDACWRSGTGFPTRHVVRVLRALGPSAADHMEEMSDVFIDNTIRSIEKSTSRVASAAKGALMFMILLLVIGTASIIGDIIQSFGKL